MNDYKKDDEEVYTFPFQNLESSSVLQETRIFNESPLRARNCVVVMTKLLYLLGQSKQFARIDATEAFFNSMRLFISTDPKLKRMLFLLIKELASQADNSFAAANSLLKEKEDQRANAIRALQKITDASVFGAMDRHLKESVVNQSASIASAALVAGLQLTDVNMELVKRWANEIQTALKSRYHMVQYHALALMYKLRHQDALAVSKLVSSNIHNFRSPLAHTLLIKYSLKVLRLESSMSSERSQTILKYLDTCLSYKNDMIVLEAAKALCSLENISPEDLTPAVTALQSFLTSMKPVQRFAAMRVLNELANRYPTLVSQCNSEIEGLVLDTNGNIATLAITTLLKIGKENNIDKLIKQITQFVSDVPDEYRVVVVEAIRSLCLKYPSKAHALLSFLSSALREDGGYEYKNALVETIIELADKIPESKEFCIAALCEFIEDCEFGVILQRVLHFLGTEGPKSENPAKCIRYVYNRIMLESALVRACAVTTLAKLAAQVPSLRKSVIDILKRILSDSDDEVRDRAVYALQVLQSDENAISALLVEDLPVDLASLKSSLTSYLQEEEPQADFDLASVVDIEPEPVHKKDQGKTGAKGTASAATDTKEPVQPEVSYYDMLNMIPQLAKLGRPFKSCSPEYITEEDADYVVSVIKHIYKDHVVFQFNVTNQVKSQQLDAVRVEMDLISGETTLSELYFIEASEVKFEVTKSCFNIMKKEESDLTELAEFSNVLKFKVRDVDPDTQEVDEVDLEDVDEDEYELQELKIGTVDYMRKVHVSFKEEWDKLEENESGDSAQFSPTKGLQECVDEVVERMGFTPMNDTNAAKKNVHSLYFSAKFGNDQLVLIAVQLAVSKENIVMIKVACRSTDPSLTEPVARILLK